MAKNLIFGCGFLGKRVARRWLDVGHEVVAVSRDPAAAALRTPAELVLLAGDVTQPESLRGLPAADCVLFAVGHDRQRSPSIEEVYVRGLANVLAALPAPPRRIIYISSTGVYGQADGSWVDEKSPCRPRRAGGLACLAAERLLRAHPWGAQAVILRCAGLYGPGRIPRLADLLGGTPIPAEPDVYLNLIHVDDAAAIACAAAMAENPAELYCVADGRPSLRREFYAELAARLQLAIPQFAPPAPSPDHRRAAGDHKRVSNRRLMTDLRVPLQYPSYREGLAASVTSGSHVS